MRLILLLLLVHVGCTGPDTRACIARCERFVADADACRTVCTSTCAELRDQYGIAESTCREIQSGRDEPATPPPSTPSTPPPGPPPPDLSPRCAAFIDFVWSCGIGRPDPDPTVDIATRQNNELIVRQALVARCAAKSPPYDERLLACFDAAAADCTRYRVCADERPTTP